MITLEKRILPGSPKNIKLPAVVLINPKITANLAMTLRACACFGVKQLWYTGNRIQIDKERLPRELRMKEYLDTEIIHDDSFLKTTQGIPKTAVEFMDGAENLFDFEHKFDMMYIIGGEDLTIPSNVLRECESFVKIPTKYCLNLAMATGILLYDRESKLDRSTNPWKL